MLTGPLSADRGHTGRQQSPFGANRIPAAGTPSQLGQTVGGRNAPWEQMPPAPPSIAVRPYTRTARLVLAFFALLEGTRV